MSLPLMHNTTKKQEHSSIISKNQDKDENKVDDYGACHLRHKNKGNIFETKIDVKKADVKKHDKRHKPKEVEVVEVKKLDKKKKKEEDKSKDDAEGHCEITVDDAVDLIGFGRFQLIALVATGMCFCADSMEIALLSFLSIEVSAEWGLSSMQAASITGVVFFGELVGALVLGSLGDRIGRRPTFLIAALIITLFGAATAIAPNFEVLLIIRLIVGFGVGGLIVPFDIFAEFLPTKGRGNYLMVINYFWTFGSLLASFFAYITFGFGRSWRIFVLLCSIPCLISAILCYWFVPESPRWLVSQNRSKEALAILRDAAHTNGKPPMHLFPLHLRLAETDEVESSNYLDLLKPKWRKINLLLWGVWFGFGFSYNGTVLVITEVFENGKAVTSDQPSFDFGPIAMSSLAETLGVFMACLTVDRWGRILSQMVYFSLAGVAGVAMLMPVVSQYENLLTMLAFSARAFEIGANCITWITTAECLKTELRTTGHSAANAFCRVGAVLTSYVVQGGTTFFHIGIIMGVIHAFIVACVSNLPETKHVKLS